MKVRALTGLVGVVLFGAFAASCKDDPAPPPVPVTSAASTSAAASGYQLPAYTDATTKRFRVELCFYGAYGVKVTREAYVASLGGKEPSETLLPSFGRFPELQDGATTMLAVASPSASASAATPRPASSVTAKSASVPGSSTPLAGRPATESYERLPYTRFLGSCTLAARKEPNAPSDEALDKATSEFEQWASTLNRQLMAAHRYYATKQYSADKFERGRSIHKELMTSFDSLDAKFDAFDKAFLAWNAALKKPDEKLDKSGETAFGALQQARALAASLLAAKPDGAAVKSALDGVTRGRDALEKDGKDDPKAPHPPELVGRLRRLMDAGAKAQLALDEPKHRTETTFQVMMEVAGIVEANHRALGKLLRNTGQTRTGASLTTLRPGATGLPGLRPNNNVRVRPPGADSRAPRERAPAEQEHPE